VAKAKSKGRPAGSTNVQYATVEHVPAACPKCGGAEFTKVPGSKVIDREICGTLRSGLAYRAIRWTRKRCACGQMLVIRTYFPTN
jgi:hypothetical protein